MSKNETHKPISYFILYVCIFIIVNIFLYLITLGFYMVVFMSIKVEGILFKLLCVSFGFFLSTGSIFFLLQTFSFCTDYDRRALTKTLTKIDKFFN